ncbi:bifunctional diaminohydroxyphosphoribosylaminopyrimidine deaminase/5-amino-6-(5-phosphoribosylamino)uracil reductase RibD, partial [Dyella sp.]|uniref:bifunctional diaminohydroxyphosphoribosylaminopyrimidine deaminase/5-amino-6-(5-phosphoribosylamino)uracil reductase RibD n=1 Tax=Dyella sp. TaxID=1869338 RepID=UPI002DA36077|nr:bifunctional diaminohydroxyphosphoribosylaminopyrimidine deaminase/5-amino-6-(5-phosphoribosylamino)uracil reductase RibD [Dyella sp.]
MTRALALAERGLFTTQPNPRVGCVIVRDGEVVGEGWHQKAGEPHAEVFALRAASEKARGATVYVTLEPCSHQGRTPPCADALIEAGVARVVIASTDPNPKAMGGVDKLRAAGITVETGLMEDAAHELNIGFFSRLERGRPWVRVKLAMSLDGRTALANGESKWITGEAARADVQRWRARSSAILTGSGTVLADDPRLTVRLDEPFEPPLRVVLDRLLRTPAHAHLLDGTAPTLILHGADADARDARFAKVECLRVPERDGRLDVHAVLALLAER